MNFFLQQVLNGIALGSVYALFALGLSLVLANLRVFNVAHEGVVTWGAVFGYGVAVFLHVSWIVALICAVVGAAVLNVIVYFAGIRYLQPRKDRELAAFISAAGMFIILRELADIFLLRKQTRLPDNIFPLYAVEIGNVQLPTIAALSIATTLAVFGILWWLFNRTHFGREVRAVAYDRETSALLGIDVDRTSVWVFAIAGACGGLAALEVATAYNIIDADVGGRYFLVAIAATVIGGFGSLGGALVSGLAIGIVSSLAGAYWLTSYRDIVVFAAMVIILWVRPKGLFDTGIDTARA